MDPPDSVVALFEVEAAKQLAGQDIAADLAYLAARNTRAYFAGFLRDFGSLCRRDPEPDEFPKLLFEFAAGVTERSAAYLKILGLALCKNDGLCGELSNLRLRATDSDFHEQNRFVAVITTTSKEAFVCKPRTADTDQFLHHILTGLGVTPNISVPPVNFRDGITYQNYVDGRSKEFNLEHAYWAGAGSVILYIVGGFDFHAGNVIRTSAGLSLIDTETIFSQCPPSRGGVDLGGLSVVPRTTLLGVGLLPVWELHPRKGKHALPGAFGPISSAEQPRLSGSEIRSACTAAREGAADMASRAQLIVELASEFLEDRRSIEVRVVRKPTRVYAAVVGSVFGRGYLSPDTIRSSLVTLLGSTDAALQECEALERGDIPKFTARLSASRCHRLINTRRKRIQDRLNDLLNSVTLSISSLERP